MEDVTVSRNFCRFKAMKAVCRCVGEATRFSFDRIKIDKHTVCATDGRQLLTIANNFDADTGFYEIVQNNQSKIRLIKVSEDCSWPASDKLPSLALDGCDKIELSGYLAQDLYKIARAGACMIPDRLDIFLKTELRLNCFITKEYDKNGNKAVFFTGTDFDGVINTGIVN